MSKFKVGDRVRVVQTMFPGYPLGGEGVVTRILPNPNFETGMYPGVLFRPDGLDESYSDHSALDGELELVS